MYNEYFHFSELPFSIAPDPHFMFMSTRHQEGLAHLLYGINHGGGFVALTGEVGTGKTTLCHCLLQQLPENIDIAFILNPKLNALELLATICDELRIRYDNSQQSLKNLVDTLNRYLISAHAKGSRTVLIIDEAQNLSLEVLEQIRLLTNLETSKTKLLQIILVGQPELKELLNRRELRQLNQRITARYHLLPLSLDETRTYIHHRLRVCNGDPELFKNSAIGQIFHFSKGIPRVINIICDCALLGAYSTDAKVITPTIIKRAAKETLADTNDKTLKLMPLLALFALSSLGAWWYYSYYTAVPPSRAETMLSDTFSKQADIKPTMPVQLAPALPKPKQKNEDKPFSAWINSPDRTLNAGISTDLKLWGKHVPANQPTDCNAVQKTELLCQFGKGNWKDILSFKRPVIMEFSLPEDTKRYALLTGIKAGQPIFRFEQDMAFSLADVLSLWDGYYQLIWKVPKTGLKTIAPGQSSSHVEWLRQQLTLIDGIKEDTRHPQYFDATLKARVINFQKNHQLIPDGKVGMQTVFYLDNATGAIGSPKLQD